MRFSFLFALLYILMNETTARPLIIVSGETTVQEVLQHEKVKPIVDKVKDIVGEPMSELIDRFMGDNHAQPILGSTTGSEPENAGAETARSTTMKSEPKTLSVEQVSQPASPVPLKNSKSVQVPKDEQTCFTFGPVRPDSYVIQPNYPSTATTAIQLKGIYTPKLNTPQQIRYYLLPGSVCENGACWRCVQSPQQGYFKGSTIESCSSTGKYNPADKKGNMITWIVKEGAKKGPNGVTLYDLYSVDVMKGRGEDDFEKVYENVMFARVAIGKENTDPGMKRYQTNLFETVVVFDPCDGRLLISRAEGIGMHAAGLHEIGQHAGMWTMAEPGEVDEKDFSFPLV